MSQISPREAEDLVDKLFEDSIALRVLCLSPSGMRVSMPGFVYSKTVSLGVGIAESGLPFDTAKGFMNVRAFDRRCEFSYGEVRELPEEVRRGLTPEDGNSVLMIRFLDFNEVVALFFTV